MDSGDSRFRPHFGHSAIALEGRLFLPDDEEWPNGKLMATKTDIPITETEREISKRPAEQLPDPDEMSLLDLLIVIARRKRFILNATLICGLAGLLISLILPKRYTAVATVLPPQQNSSLQSMLSSEIGGLGGLAALAGAGQNFLKNPNDMYMAMFKSQTVADAMIRRFDLMQEYKSKYLSDARMKFGDHFQVAETSKGVITGGSTDGLLHISVEDKDPERAAEMANAWIDQFHKLSQTLAITEASQRRLFFEHQLNDAKNNLANAEEALKRTEQTTGLLQLNSQAAALIESAAVLRGQITAKEVQLQAMQTYATTENSNVVETEKELDSLKSELAKLGGSADDSSAGLIVPKGQVPEAGLEYVRKERDVKYYETIFEILARQFEVAKLDEAKEGSVIQVVDPALVPDRKSSPRRSLITIGATFLGFIFGIFAAMTGMVFDRTSRHPETSEKMNYLLDAIDVRRRHARRK
jgi:tyrosine-protein kinase Etk/Wzc